MYDNPYAEAMHNLTTENKRLRKQNADLRMVNANYRDGSLIRYKEMVKLINERDEAIKERDAIKEDHRK